MDDVSRPRNKSLGGAFGFGGFQIISKYLNAFLDYINRNDSVGKGLKPEHP